MTRDIPKDAWKEFFDDISKRRYDWAVKIEVISEEIGDQILDEGLPLQGITVDERGDGMILEISAGDTSAQHQTHSISNPETIRYLSNDGETWGIVEILEADGTKTLVHIVQPLPLVVDYSKEKNLAAP